MWLDLTPIQKVAIYRTRYHSADSAIIGTGPAGLQMLNRLMSHFRSKDSRPSIFIFEKYETYTRMLMGSSVSTVEVQGSLIQRSRRPSIENILVIKDPDVIIEYIQEYNTLWKSSK